MVYFDLWVHVCVPFLGRNNRSFAASGANINLLHRFNVPLSSQNNIKIYSWPFPTFFSWMKNCFQHFYFHFLLSFFFWWCLQQVAVGCWIFCMIFFGDCKHVLKTRFQHSTSHKEPPIIFRLKLHNYFIIFFVTKFNDTLKMNFIIEIVSYNRDNDYVQRIILQFVSKVFVTSTALLCSR